MWLGLIAECRAAGKGGKKHRSSRVEVLKGLKIAVERGRTRQKWFELACLLMSFLTRLSSFALAVEADVHEVGHALHFASAEMRLRMVACLVACRDPFHVLCVQSRERDGREEKGGGERKVRGREMPSASIAVVLEIQTQSACSGARVCLTPSTHRFPALHYPLMMPCV